MSQHAPLGGLVVWRRSGLVDTRRNEGNWGPQHVVHGFSELNPDLLYATSEIKGVLPTALLYDIAKFTEGFFKQPEATKRLQKCKQELSKMVGLFRAQVTGSTLFQMGQLNKDAKEQHEWLVTLLECDSDLTIFDRSSVTGSLAKLGNNSSGSFGLLPPSPQICHGHEAELQDVVNILVQDSAHIAILSAGGMGKHSSPPYSTSGTTVADHIGLEKGSSMAKKIVHYFAHAPPSLLILDNLETPWKSLSSRPEVEEFVSLLTEIPHLGLMITLRGAEQPNKVKWTKPFLAPPQTFIEVADDGHDDASIKELLALTGNIHLIIPQIDSY
ncbi:hypothetical protein C8J57DRAFT_1230793 [Mycena rebaudengoi]|nr:hypothetical protein C8J57DRAFT_1230793 [Mycena rebaudengoi]